MEKRKIILFISVFAFVAVIALLLPVSSKALNTAGALNKDFHVANRASAAAAEQTNQLNNIKQRADTLIQNRLTSLNGLLTRIQNDKRLSIDEKTSLTADITTTITNLNTLKAKIDADTDVATTRTDAKSIITSYKVYAIFEPKERLLIILDNLQTLSGNVATLVGNVQVLITNQKNKGQDVTSEQASLNAITAELNTISTTLSTDKTLVSNITVSSSNPQSVFNQVRKDLTTVKAAFGNIRTNFTAIRTGLKTTLVPTTASSSAK